MDINKWKSLAVRKTTHEAILALCGKYMGPGTYVEKLVDEAVRRECNRMNMSVWTWRKKHIKSKEIEVKKRKRS